MTRWPWSIGWRGLIATNAILVACAGRDSPPAVAVPPIATEAPRTATTNAVASSSHPAEDGPTFPPGDDVATIDPTTMLGDREPVFITVDLRLVRVHPKLRNLDAPIAALAGQRAVDAGINVLRDVDHVVVVGDSLTHTQNDVMTLTFGSSTTDAQINRFTRALSSGYAKGGPFDAGSTPPVFATLAMMDMNERALLRPRSRLLVVAPVARAGEIGSTYAKTGSPRQPATNTEGLVVSLKEPSKLVSIPRLPIPPSVSHLRFSVVPHQQGDAEVKVDATCVDARAAKSFADSFNAGIDEVRRSIAVKIMTRDALKDAKLVADPKSGHATMQMTLSDDQLQAMVGVVGAFVGTTP